MDITEALRARGIGNGKRLIGDAQPTDVRVGKTFSNAQGNQNEGTLPIRSLVAQTITPGVNNITKQAGIYDGDITIEGDPDLASQNIKIGTSIFGVAGTLTGKKVASGTVTSSNTMSSSTGLNETGSSSSPGVFLATVTGLTFLPSVIIVYSSLLDQVIYSASMSTTYVLYNEPTTVGTYRLSSPKTIISTGFTMPCGTQNAVYNWIAYE